MAYIGRTKTPAPLTSADIPDGIVTAADLAPNSVDTSEIADSVTLVTPNLGTVATGDLSNSAIVYPAGHIIQTQYASENNSYDSSADSWSAYATLPALTITASHVLNPIILIMSLHTAKNNSANMSLDFYKNASDFTETYNLTGESYGFGYQVSTDVQGVHSHMMRDIAGTTEEITYRISFRPFNVNTASAGLNSALMTILAMEVMRD